MYRITKALEEFLPFILFIVFVFVATTAEKVKKKNRASQARSPRPASPLRTDVRKGNSDENNDEYEYVGVSRVNPKTAGSASATPRKDTSRDLSRYMAPKKSGSMKLEDISAYTMEDRDNDWLAKQLREERKALKSTSAMMDLKMSHMEHCEADEIKQSHARAHKAGRIH